MSSSAARRTSPLAARSAEPIIIYVARSLDGTTFALDATSGSRIREAFPGVNITTRRIFISHDTREAMTASIQRVELQIVILLTGLDSERLMKQFGAVSFRDPQTEKEVERITPATKRARA